EQGAPPRPRPRGVAAADAPGSPQVPGRGEGDGDGDDRGELPLGEHRVPAERGQHVTSLSSCRPSCRRGTRRGDRFAAEPRLPAVLDLSEPLATLVLDTT